MGAWLILVALLVWPAIARADEAAPRGLPITRFYSLGEIGNISGTIRLGFDPLGRIAAIQARAYIVLNDTTWMNLADLDMQAPSMLQLVYDRDGQGYYASFGSWGTVDTTSRGTLRAHPLGPKNRPKWLGSTELTNIIPTKDGVYFGGLGGVVYWDRHSGSHSFFEVPEITQMFSVGDQVFISTHARGIEYINCESRTLQPATREEDNGLTVDQATPLNAGATLVSTHDGRLMIFDGRHFTPWTGALGERANGKISALLRLPDGNVAVAITGTGLYILSQTGKILSALTGVEYHKITQLASRESGVLWMAGSNGIAKILYDHPITVVDQRIGLPTSWPQVVRCRGRTYIVSGGKLYEAVPGAAGEPSSFRTVPGQPRTEIWGVAAAGSQLLVGNSDGAYIWDDDGQFRPIATGIEVARLVMVEPDLCFMIGTTEIGVLRRKEGRWTECAPRVPGLGYPAIVHAAKRSAWLEIGPNRVGRVALKDGHLSTRLFEEFPWTEPRWVAANPVGDSVVLGTVPNARLFFDENTETFRDEPRLREMLEQLPRTAPRFVVDDEGTLWAAYMQGLIKVPHATEPVATEMRVFDTDSGAFPFLQLVDGHDVWLTTGEILYHVERRFPSLSQPIAQPILTAVVNSRSNRELAHPNSVPAVLDQFPYAENSLSFRFFSGSYAWPRPPTYEYRLNPNTTAWTPIGAGSVLTLPGLREGAYQLEVRLTNAGTIANRSLHVRFSVAPPWFRTWYAYGLYGVGFTGVVFGLVGWTTRQTRRKNDKLERLVRQRTEELENTMKRLAEETKNAAIHAERSRLASEIHDSLQQGLTGIMLQLDATLKSPDVPNHIRERLGVARNMVSYSRHEVQNAVWDIGSPLLSGAELVDALNKLASLIGPGGEANVTIAVTGRPFPLSAAIEHHLLRIAQEGVTNAVRHASPRKITVTLHYDIAAVSLTIADDGVGFSPDRVLSGGIGHFGLRGLRTRVTKIGAKFELQSAPGSGTTLRVTVPVARSLS